MNTLTALTLGAAAGATIGRLAGAHRRRAAALELQRLRSIDIPAGFVEYLNRTGQAEYLLTYEQAAALTGWTRP